MMGDPRNRELNADGYAARPTPLPHRPFLRVFLCGNYLF